MRRTSSCQRTTGGKPAVSEEVEAEAVDAGGRQVKEHMFIRRVEDLQAQSRSASTVELDAII